MLTRVLLEVALRVLGVAYALSAISTVASTIPVVASAAGPPGANSYGIWVVGDGVVRVLLSAALVFWAPAIAAWLYRPSTEPADASVKIGAGDLYQIACLVLGMYVLVLAIEPALRAMVILYQQDQFGRRVQLAADVGMSVTYAVVGSLLIFGAERLRMLFANLSYDADSVPKQRFSLAVLLIFIVLFAVLLTVLRRFS